MAVSSTRQKLRQFARLCRHLLSINIVRVLVAAIVAYGVLVTASAFSQSKDLVANTGGLCTCRSFPDCIKRHMLCVIQPAYLDAFSILLVAVLYVIETPYRRRKAHLGAWQIIDQAKGIKTSYARFEALQDLNKDGVKLNRLIVKDAYLESINLQKAKLVEADLCNTDLSYANLSSADLREAKLDGAILVEANLSKAKLGKAILCKSNLSLAVLRMADLRGADLQQSDMTSSELQGATLIGAQLQSTQLIGAQLADAKLAAAKLVGAQLQNANLTGADLNGANLSGANLNQAKLQNTNLTNTILNGADLDRANLTGAKNLTLQQVQVALNWRTAKLPLNLTPPID